MCSLTSRVLVCGRLTALRSLTLQTGVHNEHVLADLGALRSHPSLLDLRLLHHREPRLTEAPLLEQPLPERLTSLRLHEWGCGTAEQSLNFLVAGTRFCHPAWSLCMYAVTACHCIALASSQSTCSSRSLPSEDLHAPYCNCYPNLSLRAACGNHDISPCRCAGLTALRSLSLVDCCLQVDMSGADWIRVLRRASELDFNGGTLIVDALNDLIEKGTVGEGAMPCL